jgi:glycosyltransferase involved in cell wall biosynthesis
MTPVRDTISPVISLVTPAYNEEENLASLHARLVGVMASTGLSWEWIVVDDHSADSTFAVLSRLAAGDAHVRGVRLARNFGSHPAILCGLAAARGEAAIVLAADGQDPPEEIPRLIAAWRAGNAIVWAEKRTGTPGPWRAGRLSWAFHGLLRRVSGLHNLAPAGSDFFLVTRPVLDIVNTLAERNTNVMALLAWIGFDQARIAYDKTSRARGASGWTTAKKITLLLDSVLGFSVRPIQAISVLGFVIALLGFIYAAAVIANAVFGRPVEGWSSLMVVVLVLGGGQMIMLGVLGEYLWRALDESRRRPRYIIERRTEARTAEE